MQLEFVLLVCLAFIIKINLFSQALLWSPQSQTETNVYLQGFTLESFKSNTVMECYDKCANNPRCCSININLSDQTCELKWSTKVRRPDDTAHRENVIYMEVREHILPGENQDHPITSCKSLKSPHNASSGVYWMKLDENVPPFQVYCEMEIDGGGWTLVYSYSFTLYDDFLKLQNALTPRPNWPLPYAVHVHTPTSTTIPLNTTAEAAMDFSLWKVIGSEVLVASDINDWFVCSDGGGAIRNGSFVKWIQGSLTCKRIKEIVPKSYSCVPGVPNWFYFGYCGPRLRYNNDHTFYMWDSDTIDCWP